MKFTFSIRGTLKKSWNLFAKHASFFLTLAFVVAVFSIFSEQHKGDRPMDIVLTILVIIASILWSYVWTSSVLAAVDGHEDLLTLRNISQHMPSVRQFFVLVGTGILVGIVVAFGFVLLVIPGVYFLIRLAFANTAVVDRQQGVLVSMKYSWHLVQGKVFWTVLLVFIVSAGLLIIGSIAFGVGLLITYPIAMLLMAQLYRDLTVYHRESEAAAIQE